MSEGFVNKSKTVCIILPTFYLACLSLMAQRLAMLSVGMEKEQDLIYKNMWQSHNTLVMMTYSLLKITQFCATVFELFMLIMLISNKKFLST